MSLDVTPELIEGERGRRKAGVSVVVSIPSCLCGKPKTSAPECVQSSFPLVLPQ